MNASMIVWSLSISVWVESKMKDVGKKTLLPWLAGLFKYTYCGKEEILGGQDFFFWFQQNLHFHSFEKTKNQNPK